VDEDFVIIDDDKFLNELPDFLTKSLIQTSPYVGLTEEHSEAIKSIYIKSDNLHNRFQSFQQVKL
jgi:hypothetical protein